MPVVIGDPAFDDGKLNLFEILTGWMQDKTEVEFDIETNVSDWWCDKKVDTVQFGNKDDQFVLRWKYLSAEQKDYVKSILENPHLTKIIHNALFECTVMLFHGIRVQNVYDTMLAEMVLQGGEHNVGYGLDDVCYRYLGISLDKSQQKEFGEDKPLTPEKITYATQDVKYLGSIKEGICKAAAKLSYDTFDKVVELENSCVPAFAEMTFNGMELDKDWWLKLAAEAEPLVAAAQKKLNNWLKEEPFNSKAKELGYLSDEDRVLINWNSPKQKSKIFSTIYPELPGTSKQVLKKWQSDRMKNQQSVPSWLPSYIDGYYTELQTELIFDHKQWLIEENLLLPAGTPMINWNSQVQVLPIIQVVEPKIDNLSAETKGRCSHPIVSDLDEYIDATKLVTTYGEEWLKYVEPDGKVRTSFKQVLTTGRISSSGPNMQQIPAKENVGNKYRNAFIPPAGWSFVSSDYVSQELIVIAYLSKDPVWQEALSKGQDLHSIAAEMVFGKKWKDAAESGCSYYKFEGNTIAKQKCKCTSHKYMRNGVKTINFG